MKLSDPTLLMESCRIGAEWRPADSGQTFGVRNPATGEQIGAVPNMGLAETHRAVAAASSAFRSWSRRTAKDRSSILRRWFDLINANIEDLACIMTSEQGKPLAESRAEVSYAAAFIEWFAEEAKRVYGDTIPSPAADKRVTVIRQPVGVCAMITPWNFPAAMITRKVAPALAAGCTAVIKPAEQTPLTAFALVELAVRAGVPDGVLNVVTGDPVEIGAVFTSSPLVRKVSFTGSTEIGRLLMGQCAPTVKRLSLELGGNAPLIVFDDADLDAAVEGAIVSKFRNTGQTCVCANRIYVQAGVYDEFSKKLTHRVSSLKVGNGMNAGVEQGPLIDQPALEKVQRHVADALAKGGRILCGGKPHALGGTFYEPTVIADANAQMLCAIEETFGPVAPLFRFNMEAEALDMANQTEVGLASYFYSENVHRCTRVAEALECGMVGINTGAISNEVAPFGGIKQSGIGREGGKYGIEEYLQYKYISLGGM